LTLVPENRVAWAALAAICVGRVARLPHLPTMDGWFLRAATVYGIAWWVIPETIPEPLREEAFWFAPSTAVVMFLYWVILERIADGATALCLTLCFLAAGAVLLHAGIARY